MRFSLIIPTKDRTGILNKTLDHLKKVKNINDIEVILINDSKDPIQSELNSFPVPIKVYRNPVNGVASGRNFGASKASHEWLIFMDDDMLVQPDSFQKLIPLCDPQQNSCWNVNWVYPPEVVANRSKQPFLRYLNKYNFDSLEGWSNDVEWNNKQIFRVKGITSQFLLIHKNVFSKSGGYNASFPFAGFEDYDLSKRLKAKDISVYLDPNNTIYHNEEDRLDVESFLERRKRGAITRKVAVSVGYDYLALNYSLIKKTIYPIIYSCRHVILWVLQKWPQTIIADKIYFQLVNILFGAYSYKGYSKD